MTERCWIFVCDRLGRVIVPVEFGGMGYVVKAAAEPPHSKVRAARLGRALIELAHHSACPQPFPDSVSQHDKNDNTVKEATEKNHESIQTDRSPLITGLALHESESVANDRGKEGERQSEWEGYHLKDGVSSNNTKRNEANCNKQTDCQ
jgi:hypothetical protein